MFKIFLVGIDNFNSEHYDPHLSSYLLSYNMLIIYASSEICNKIFFLGLKVKVIMQMFHMILLHFRCYAASGVPFWFDIIWKRRES
jgi:hypothetical protein